MLVNAATSPGPAMWQGIMLLVLCVVAHMYFCTASRFPDRFPDRFAATTWVYGSLVVVIGIVLFVIIA